MSPTDVPAEPSKDVQTLAPPAEKGPSSVDEGEKGGLEKTPKEEKQYRDNGKDDSGTDSSASKGTAGWRKERKRKRALRNLSRSPEPGSARQGPSGITQVAAKLGMSSASDTRDGSGAKGHSAGPSKKRNKKNKKNSAKKQSSTAQAAPTSAGASTGPSSLPRTDYLEEMYDEYPFRTYVEALKLANEEKAEEARVLFGETGELFQPGDNPPGSLYFTGLSSLNIERGWSWYKMRIPNLPLDLGEGDQADVKKRRIIVGTVMVLRIGWLLEKVEPTGIKQRDWFELGSAPGPSVIVSYEGKQPRIPPSTRVMLTTFDSIGGDLRKAKMIL